MKHNKGYTEDAVRRYVRMLNVSGVSGYWKGFTLTLSGSEYKIKVRSPLTGKMLTWTYGKISQ